MNATRTAEEILASLPPLPEKHALDFYSVLGTVKGLLLCLGYGDDAETEAVERLRRCRPDRPHRGVAGGLRRHSDETSHNPMADQEPR